MKVFKSLQFFLCTAILCLVCVSCDSTTAEEYKAQAIGYAESGERAKAVEAYLKAAEKNDPEAQFAVGFLYQIGDRIPDNPLQKDTDSAIMWLQKAANQNFGDALILLGQIYLDGLGVKEDKSKAIEYFQKALNNDKPIAAYYLGDIYQWGRGVSKDQKKAIKYYNIAYDNNVLVAGLCLSSIYLHGQGEDFIKGTELGNESFEKVRNVGLNPLEPLRVLQYDLGQHCKKVKI